MLVLARGTRQVPPPNADDVPLPFAFSSTPEVRGSLVTLGRKTGKTVRLVNFDAGETAEELQGAAALEAVDFIVTPDSEAISHGAPLCLAVTAGKRYFGYKYTSRSAAAEKAARDEADAGIPKIFTELFAGEFFASAEQRADGAFISDFESQKGIVFEDACNTVRRSCVRRNVRERRRYADKFGARRLLTPGRLSPPRPSSSRRP